MYVIGISRVQFAHPVIEIVERFVGHVSDVIRFIFTGATNVQYVEVFVVAIFKFNSEKLNF